MSDGGGRGHDGIPPPITGSAAVEISGPTVHGEATIGPLTQIEGEPWNPERRRENIRAWMAGLLVAAFLLLTGGIVLAVICDWVDMATAKDLSTLTLTPLFGLTSTAVGFYYAGGRS